MKRLVLVSLFTVLGIACTGPAGGLTGADKPVHQGRTLTIAVKYEVSGLSPKLPGRGANTREFNAFLSLIDDTGTPQPYLAETLPELNTSSWRVFPDGTMETTYQLRQGLTWQDGAPLTAEDFVFAFQVYRDPALGFVSHPENLMES